MQNEVVVSLIASSFALATAVFTAILQHCLGQRATRENARLRHDLEKKLEAEKEQYRRETETAIYPLKGQIDVLVAAQQFRNQTLHARQFDALMGLLSKLVDLHTRIERMTGVLPPESTLSGLLEDAAKTYNDFRGYFERHRILFDDNVVEAAQTLDQAYRKVLLDVEIVERNKQTHSETADKASMRVMEAMHEKIPLMRQRLREQMRRVLSGGLEADASKDANGAAS